VFINDDEGGLYADYKKRLEKLAPHEPTGAYKRICMGWDTLSAPHARPTGIPACHPDYRYAIPFGILSSSG
jgi:hypothetical protein